MNYLGQIQKAIVPLVVAGVLSLLAVAGVTEGMTVGEAVTLVVTSGFVWLIPNKGK